MQPPEGLRLWSFAPELHGHQQIKCPWALGGPRRLAGDLTQPRCQTNTGEAQDNTVALRGRCPPCLATGSTRELLPGAIFIQERGWETVFPPREPTWIPGSKGLKDRESTYSTCGEPYPRDSRAPGAYVCVCVSVCLEETNSACLSSCSRGDIPLVELCVEPAGFSGRTSSSPRVYSNSCPLSL